MPRSSVCLLAGVVHHLLLGCCLALAQDSAAPAPSAAGKAAVPQSSPANPPQVEKTVEESLPSIIYLPDKQGNPQAVLNFPFEEFEKAYQWTHQLAQRSQPPQFNLQRISVTGTAAAAHAELTVQVDVLVHTDGWVRVPLGFDRAVLRQPAEYAGPGEGFVHLEANGDGHVAWIRGQPHEQHQLTLRLLSPLTVLGEQTKLRLLIPRATVSQLTLTVPVDQAVASVSEGAVLGPPSYSSGATKFTALGPAGDFELAWHQAGKQSVQPSAVLEVQGDIFAQIQSRSVQTQASLLVGSHAAPIDRFRVRLPEGADLLPEESSAFEVIEVPASDSATPAQRVVEVRRAKSSTEPFQVCLATSRPLEAGRAQDWFELAGFDVLGAVRQSGHIAIAASGDSQVLWQPGRGVRQIDQVPEKLRRKDVLACFEYSAQPCSLTARLVAQQTRISLQPQYLLLVAADRVRLEATLKYTIRGAKASMLEVILPAGWELDAVGPENLVATDRVALVDPNLLCIPLRQPQSGEITIKVSAHRPVPQGAASLLLPLPQPQTGLPGQAAVVVLPADNVELIPKDESMVGLVRQPLDSPMELPARQQPPLSYRTTAPEATFAAELRLHKQHISVDVAGQLTLDEQAGNVEQKLTYTIAYEPADHLTLEVPQSLAHSGGLNFLLAGQPVTPAAPDDRGDPQQGPETVRRRIDLPQAVIGPCTLVVRYPFEFPPLVPDKQVVLAVPLVMPAEGKLSQSKLCVTAPADMEIEPRQDSWKTLEPAASLPGRQCRLELGSDQPAGQVKLAVRSLSGGQAAATVVQRAWVQTWLAGPAEQDRAVYCFTSDRRQLEVIVPRDAAGGIEAWLDGEPLPANVSPDRRLTVPLAEEQNLRRHVLELRWHLAAGGPPRQELSIELPQLGQGVWVRRLYWQLVLPRNEHVLTAPQGFTSEYTWSWSGFCWGRKPLLDEADLEAWTGAPHRDPVAASNNQSLHEEANHYLFSSFGNVDRCEVRVADRTWIVLLASGAALVAGLLLIYVPASRRPGSLLAAAVLLLCIGTLYPEPTLLLAQAASLGLALTLMAGLLERTLARHRRAAAPAALPGALLDGGSTQVQYELPAALGQGSTRSAPLAPPPPTMDATP